MDEAREKRLASWRKWYAKNRERQAAYLKKWHQENPEKAKAIRSRYYLANREEIRAQQAEYRKTHRQDPKKLAAATRRHREKNRETINARVRTQMAERKAKDEAYRLKLLNGNLKYRRENRAKVLACEAAYRRANPEKLAHDVMLRRALKKGAEGSHTLEEWRALLARYGHRCAYCGTPISGRNATRDHKIPLSRRGTNGIENIVPACRTCNSSKNSKTHEEFLTRPNRFLG